MEGEPSGLEGASSPPAQELQPAQSETQPTEESLAAQEAQIAQMKAQIKEMKARNDATDKERLSEVRRQLVGLELVHGFDAVQSRKEAPLQPFGLDVPSPTESTPSSQPEEAVPPETLPSKDPTAVASEKTTQDQGVVSELPESVSKNDTTEQAVLPPVAAPESKPESVKSEQPELAQEPIISDEKNTPEQQQSSEFRELENKLKILEKTLKNFGKIDKKLYELSDFGRFQPPLKYELQQAADRTREDISRRMKAIASIVKYIRAEYRKRQQMIADRSDVQNIDPPNQMDAMAAPRIESARNDLLSHLKDLELCVDSNYTSLKVAHGRWSAGDRSRYDMLALGQILLYDRELGAVSEFIAKARLKISAEL